jgi:hypothetical protein
VKNLFIFFIMGMVYAFPILSEARQEVSWLTSENDCVKFVSPEAKLICTRVIRSREILENEHPKLIPDKRGRVVFREIMIVAWDEKDTAHTIKLQVPFRVAKPEDLKVMTLTPGYTVERVRGTGLYKLQFRVQHDGKELFVYGGKHVWLPQPYAKEWMHAKLVRVMEERQYLPFQDHIFHQEFVQYGKEYLEARINSARAELMDVSSRAFAGKTLGEMYPPEMILNVIVTEHTDPYLVFGKRKHSTLPPASFFLGTLIEFAFHGPHTVADLCSSAPACGWTQFTNKSKKLKDGTFWPGTYTYTYRECRKRDGSAVLMEDFAKGTHDTHNAIKAAICYLDLEKMALPQEAREEFLKDPMRGSTYMLTAYNAGGGWSKRVFMKVKKLRLEFADKLFSLEHETLPRSLFENGSFYNEESHLYIKKYLWLWELLYPNRPIVVPVMGGR